jgi:hypothetical protein
MGAKSKTGLSLFNPLSYYHQHHHHFHHPDGVPEEEWCDEYGVAEGVGFGYMWIFVIFLILILLLFI